jgi:hypothetical protein
MTKKLIKTDRDLHDNYDEFFTLLAAYFAGDVDNDIIDTDYTIDRFCNTTYPETINKTVSQANEILSMEPFPYDAIETATNLLISKATDETQKSEEVTKWLRHVLHLLELRVTGKL